MLKLELCVIIFPDKKGGCRQGHPPCLAVASTSRSKQPPAGRIFSLWLLLRADDRAVANAEVTRRWHAVGVEVSLGYRRLVSDPLQVTRVLAERHRHGTHRAPDVAGRIGCRDDDQIDASVSVPLALAA